MEKQSSILSTLGIGIGAIALLSALLHFWAGPFTEQPELKQTVAEAAAAFKEATIAALNGEEIIVPQSTPQKNIDKTLQIIIATLAGLAIILGVIGYARKDPIHVSSGAVFLGVGAIAFQLITLVISNQ